MSDRPALKPVYLISGSDRPKVDTAVHRLRARFVPESVEVVSALEASGADVVTLCNSGSLFGDARLVARQRRRRPQEGGQPATDRRLEGRGRRGDRRLPRSAGTDTVLALVGLEVKKDAALAKACAKAGDLLLVRRCRTKPRRLGRGAVPAGRGQGRAGCLCAPRSSTSARRISTASRTRSTKIATWAQGEPVGVDEIELLVAPVADVPRSRSRMLGRSGTPAPCSIWPRRCFERSDKPRRDTAPRLTGSLNGTSTRHAPAETPRRTRAFRRARPRRR